MMHMAYNTEIIQYNTNCKRDSALDINKLHQNYKL